MKLGFINWKIIILFLCFISFYNVNAEEFSLSLNCNKKEVVVLNQITCDVNVSTDANINNISFAIESNGFNLTFEEASGFTNNSTASGISIHKEGITTGKVGTLTITAPGNIQIGKNTIILKNILATDGSDITLNQSDNVTQEITVFSNKSSNNSLKDLLINDKTIEGFSASKNEYSITINTDKAEITALSEDTKAQVEVENGNSKTLVVGSNGPYKIIVTAEDGSVNTYQVTIKYEIPKNSDNTLKSLELYYGDEKLDFTYDIAKTEFNINVEAFVNKIKIKSELNDEKASFVKKYENRDVNLGYGKNKVEIRVKAENDSVKNYVLNITREDDRNTNNTLSSLIINGEQVKLSSSIFEYRVDVRYRYNRSEIIATPTSDKAQVEFANIDLVDGENKPIVIAVTAENKQKQEYKIIINRLSEEESKVILQNVTIEGYDFQFDANVRDYDLKLKKGDKSLKINVIPSEDIQYEILNNQALSDGSTVIIRVTDDDGLRSYTINIHKDMDKILGMPTELVCLGVFAIGIISLFSSIVYVSILNRKKNK